MRKRLEEAATIAAIEDTNKGRKRNNYFISAVADHENGFREGYIEGAEYGYKEAIALAKEWLKENYHLFDHFDKDEIIADFETDMNKFWE